MTLRCIATPSADTRCRREASSVDGTYTCSEHRRPRWWIDQWQTATTRRMLALTAWETVAEGQRLINEYTGQAA